MTPSRRFVAVLLLLVPLLAAACAGGAATEPPRDVVTPDDAAALVIESEPAFEGIGKADPNLIGGCCFYTARSTGDAFEVVIEAGWGDCQAGCIDRHHWTYAVTPTGTITLVGEDGPPVPAGVPGAGAGGGSGIPPGGTGIAGHVVAGPTCPVVQVGDASCDDRPVAGATIVVLDGAGTEIARVRSDAAGAFQVALPAGRYVLEPQPVEGLMGVPATVTVAVEAAIATVDLAYDTGIR